MFQNFKKLAGALFFMVVNNSRVQAALIFGAGLAIAPIFRAIKEFFYAYRQKKLQEKNDEFIDLYNLLYSKNQKKEAGIEDFYQKFKIEFYAIPQNLSVRKFFPEIKKGFDIKKWNGTYAEIFEINPETKKELLELHCRNIEELSYSLEQNFKEPKKNSSEDSDSGEICTLAEQFEIFKQLVNDVRSIVPDYFSIRPDFDINTWDGDISSMFVSLEIYDIKNSFMSDIKTLPGFQKFRDAGFDLKVTYTLPSEKPKI